MQVSELYLSQDGTLEFIIITNEIEIIPIVKYWLPHVRVLEPTWISEMIDVNLEVYVNKGVGI